MVDGSRAGDRLEVPPGRSTIGRKGDLELVLDDAGVSRVHARVERTGDAVRLTDLGSTNGTTVNDRPVTSAQPLVDGDRVGIGSVELAFEGARHPATGPGDTSGRAAPRTPASGRRRVRLVRVLVVGGLVEAAVVVAIVVGIVATGGVLGSVLLVLAPVLGLAAAAVSIVRQERAGRAAERHAVPAAQPGGEPPTGRPDASAGPRTVATPGGPAVPAPPTEPTTRPRARGMDSTTTEAPRIDADTPASGAVTAAVAAVVSVAVVGLAGGLVVALVALVVQATGVV
ncbi:FHA domain-containing protein [Agromyces mangrovi Wang et al. 2018]|uniref:FHA domain-containing protein n=1 Tax=Agromyces mangrovi TaxID=1858653 RepID=UPI00257268C8|nr:FHA domain-containing protein [Agromyces mangrovi]